MSEPTDCHGEHEDRTITCYWCGRILNTHSSNEEIEAGGWDHDDAYRWRCPACYRRHKRKEQLQALREVSWRESPQGDYRDFRLGD